MLALQELVGSGGSSPARSFLDQRDPRVYPRTFTYMRLKPAIPPISAPIDVTSYV
jgi:hypothetical protein